MVWLVLEVAVSFVCDFNRGWEVLTVLWTGLVSSRTRQVTYVYISPVRAYFRYDLDIISAWRWVWLRMGTRPWYMAVRFMRSMWMPHVQLSICWGVLWMWILGVSCIRTRGAMSSHVYHWRSVVCIMLIAEGGWRLRES